MCYKLLRWKSEKNYPQMFSFTFFPPSFPYRKYFEYHTYNTVIFQTFVSIYFFHILHLVQQRNILDLQCLSSKSQTQIYLQTDFQKTLLKAGESVTTFLVFRTMFTNYPFDFLLNIFSLKNFPFILCYNKFLSV